MFKRVTNKLVPALVLAGWAGAAANATELVYYPLNPSFGGNPLNGSVLLNSAQATNRHTDPDLDADPYGMKQPSALDDFKQSLERSILNRVASAASSKLIDANGNYVPGTLQTENFIITIADIGGGLFSITTVDKATGGTTTFQVGK